MEYHLPCSSLSLCRFVLFSAQLFLSILHLWFKSYKLSKHSFKSVSASSSSSWVSKYSKISSTYAGVFCLLAFSGAQLLPPFSWGPLSLTDKAKLWCCHFCPLCPRLTIMNCSTNHFSSLFTPWSQPSTDPWMLLNQNSPCILQLYWSMRLESLGGAIFAVRFWSCYYMALGASVITVLPKFLFYRQMLQYANLKSVCTKS